MKIDKWFHMYGRKDDVVFEEVPSFGRWIPCSERLPEVCEGTCGEVSDDVLICVLEPNTCITISTGFYGYYPDDKSMLGWWDEWADGFKKLGDGYTVLAWMPLPELYGLEDDE